MNWRTQLIKATFLVIIFVPLAVAVLDIMPSSGVETQSTFAVNEQQPKAVSSTPDVVLPVISRQPTEDLDSRKLRDDKTPSEIMDTVMPVKYQDILWDVSQEYIATTPDEADKVARSIAFLDGKNESASLACGPISVAILKDAGLLPANTSTHDIWLLCARDREDCDGIKTLQREYFPLEEYDYLRVYESIRTYDFKSNPLQTGDWLYLFASENGFDHMLVVTKVDTAGAAYTVTNINRGDGFIIIETPLYDPNNPGQGLVYEFTDNSRGDLGLSGNGGFLLIRKKLTPNT